MDRALIDSALTDFRKQWDSSEPYIVAYTSGSTGTPKRIELPKHDMVASAEATCKFFGINSSSLLHLCLSTDYIAGKMMLVRSYISKAEIFAEPPSNTPLKGYHGKRITLSAIVPSQIEGIINSGASDKIESLIVGGAPMTAAQERRLIDAGINAYATYGMTETCSHVALRRVGDSVYKAMPGITFDTDERGCLVINALHYSFNMLITNDLVTLNNDMTFTWRGRYDNVINSGGIKIAPEETEKKLAPFFTDTEFFITSRPSDLWGEEVIIVVPENFSTDEAITAYCREVLPRTHCPKAIVRVANFHRTTSGKLIRRF